jgi:hypothetical protein
MSEFNEISRVDSYLDSLAKISRWALSLVLAISILSVTSSHDYVFHNINVPKRLTYIVLAFLGVCYAFLSGQYVGKIRIAFHVFRDTKTEIVKAVISHGTIFNMFFQPTRKGLISIFQLNVINLIFFVIMYSSLYFYCMDILPDYYETLSFKKMMEIGIGAFLMFVFVYTMNKWFMNPACIILRESSPSKEEGRLVVLRMLKYKRVINLTSFLCVILLVYLS